MNIIHLSRAEYQTLSTTGTLTKAGVTYTFDPFNNTYVVPDGLMAGNGINADEFSEHRIIAVAQDVIDGAAAGATAVQTETDPTVPSWAKAASKPTYTASEVGARPSDWTPTKSDVGLGNVGNFKAVSTVAVQGLTDTEKSNARANIGAGTSSFSGDYNDLTNKPQIIYHILGVDE